MKIVFVVALFCGILNSSFAEVGQENETQKDISLTDMYIETAAPLKVEDSDELVSNDIACDQVETVQEERERPKLTQRNRSLKLFKKKFKEPKTKKKKVRKILLMIGKCILAFIGFVIVLALALGVIAVIFIGVIALAFIIQDGF